eukprot:gene1481-1638_t
MDWKLCIICQANKTGEPLQCPAISKRKDVGASYSSFANNLQEFRIIGSVPGNLNLENLDDGQGVEKTLMERKASWHKTCRNAFSNAKLERAKKRKHECDQDDESDTSFGTEFTTSPIKARRSSIPTNTSTNYCIFCDSSDSPEHLHAASTLEIDRKVRECASLVHDNKLIGKLASGDMIAIEAKYHTKCLVGLYNKARKVKCSCTNGDSITVSSIDTEELAFTELLALIDESIQIENLAVLKLSDLAKFYSSRLSEVQGRAPKVNTTRLKARILASFPDLTAHTQGREVLFVLGNEIGGVLLDAKNRDSEAFYLAKAAMIVRREILQIKNCFNGTFLDDCQANSVPASLVTLLNMIMRGPTTKRDTTGSQACLTVAQLIVYNSISRFRNISSDQRNSYTHHVRNRECPLPIYTAVKIRGTTREKSLIDTFYKLGLSVDNIDHNPSATSSQGSFHGTAISLVQHLTTENSGTERPIDVFDPNRCSSSKKITTLPPYYTDVPPFTLPSTNIAISDSSNQLGFEADQISPQVNYEDDWLESARQTLTKEEIGNEEAVSWAAYHASRSSISFHQPAIISLLPMFTENAHSLAMVAHSINVTSKAIMHLNPSQIPVITADQPLFALAKQIQWITGGAYDEDHLLVMMGGLHIEIAAFKALGKWLNGSGWVEALINASVASSGVADSFLSASHITRTRRAHQITAAALHILMKKAYDECSKSNENNSTVEPFGDWKDERMKKCPQFLYWATVLEFELLCLKLVKAFREGNFSLYLQAIHDLLPWMFALDCFNYSRWLSVHYRDMSELLLKHPDLFKEFENGSFVAHKTKRLFSAIALDQAHEQVNAIVKGEGGAIGLTENPAALRRWMVGGPELARMVKEFENVTFEQESQKHHEQKPAIQAAFAKDVSKLVATIDELSNPFREDGENLTALHTKDIMNEDVVFTVRNARNLGEMQCKKFFKERLKEKTKPLTDAITKNNFSTFNIKEKKVISKDKTKVTVLKEDCALFSRLYIACQNRDGNLEDFFRFENQPWPPSLSKMGQLRGGSKADLVGCLTGSLETEDHPVVDAAILDGAVIVQMLQPKTVTTFEEYFDLIFAPYILRQLQYVKRLDIVWDIYKEDSLKKTTREKRGSGQRRKVTPSTRIPSDWKGFLRVSNNKDELFKLLATKVVSLKLSAGKTIFATHGENVLSSEEMPDMSALSPCTHEEADTRMIIHTFDASLHGHRRIKIRSNDTDVVVLAVAFAPLISIDELWISYGPSKQIRNLPAHSIATSIGQKTARVLPLFHALTGCDTVSFFGGRGKKTAWEVEGISRANYHPRKVDDAAG